MILCLHKDQKGLIFMKKRTLNDILNLSDGRFEHYKISKQDFTNIKNFINLIIQDNYEIFSNEIDFCKSFICVEFHEGYIAIYHYNPLEP